MESSRYLEFRERGPLSQTIHPDTEDEGRIYDRDGSALYETDWMDLLHTIIKYNDVALLRQYVAKHPRTLGPGDLHDPFATAASYGSTDALRVLLEHWAASPALNEAPEARGFLLLHLACQSARVDTVRFLLETGRDGARFGRSFGDIHAREDRAHGRTALLAAAESYLYLKEDRRRDSEELMRLLLDQGACADDAILHPDRGDRPPQLPLDMVDLLPDVDQPLGTVLSLAIAQASADLVATLIDRGADVLAKTVYVDTEGLFDGPASVAWDITPLHLGALYSNIEGIRALIDRRGSGVEMADMVSAHDNFGRLPLHWAVGSAYTKLLPGDDTAVESRVISTIQLLLTGSPKTIDAQDRQGNTALHYAARNYTLQGSDNSLYYDIIKTLCENGADASVRGKKRRTALHTLLKMPRAHAIDTTLVSLLLAHGAEIGDADEDGTTVLHFATRSSRNLDMMRFLLGQGAAVGAIDSKGNTPLHVLMAHGDMFMNVDRNGRAWTPEDRVRAQDDMASALLAGQPEEDITRLICQLNGAGKTPVQLREERRSKWRQDHESYLRRLQMPVVGRGRGRGRGRVAGNEGQNPSW